MAGTRRERSPVAVTSETYFDALASEWLHRYRTKRGFRSRLSTLNRVLAEEASARPLRAAIDFGSGPGLFGVLASAYAPIVVCVDSSVEMLMAGATVAGRRQIDRLLAPLNAPETCGTVHRVAGSSGCISRRPYFDLVLAIAVLEYVPNVPQVFRDLAKASLPGGLLVCSVPRRQSLYRRMERVAVALGLLVRRFRGQVTADRAYHSYRPHGDEVPWESAAKASGWALRRRVPLPLANTGVLAHMVPNEVLLFDRLAEPT